jgi:hypothetical protein
LANLKTGAIEKGTFTNKGGHAKKYNLKVLRANDDIFIDDDKPTNEINPITINQTININKAVSSTISIMNIEKTAKVKTNKSKKFDLFDSDEE